MSNIVIITSTMSLGTDNKPFTYSEKRSHFSDEERFRQTIATVINAQQFIKNNGIIYLVDSSHDTSYANEIVKNYKNVRIHKIPYDLKKLVHTHPHKTYCETALLLDFLQNNYYEVLKYSNLIKLSGRYLIDESEQLLKLLEVDASSDKFIFKEPLEWKWQDVWGVPLVDIREKTGKDVLNSYCSVMYSVGMNKLRQYMAILYNILQLLQYPDMYQYDMEMLLYRFTRRFHKDIMELDYKITGWDGSGGSYMRY